MRVGGPGGWAWCGRAVQVAVGNEYRTTEDNLNEGAVSQHIAARGQGGQHHSTVGLTTQDGGRLNYEETVVYEGRAAIPSYLIVYRF